MLLFLDGQAHYDTAGIATKYSTVSSTACTWAIAAEGRFGNCIRRVSTSNDLNPGCLTVAPFTTRLGTWSPTASGVCGFAIKIDDVSRVNDYPIHHLNSAFLTIVEGASWHLGLYLNNTGTFSLIRKGNTLPGGDLLLAQSIEGLTSGTWMFVECKWVIHPSTGSFELRVNGTTVLTYAGNTFDGTLATTLTGIWNAVRLHGTPSAPTPFLVQRVCDFYLADLASADADDVSDFLGDGVIETILPDGVGATTGWTPSAGANWDTVNDSPAPDGDATYVATTPPNTLDTYTYTDLPSGALVKGAQVCILARKVTEGGAAIAPVVHQGGTDYVGPTQGVASLAYDRYVTQAYDLNPATLAKFTAAEINAGQFGVKKVV